MQSMFSKCIKDINLDTLMDSIFCLAALLTCCCAKKAWVFVIVGSSNCIEMLSSSSSTPPYLTTVLLAWQDNAVDDAAVSHTQHGHHCHLHSTSQRSTRFCCELVMVQTPFAHPSPSVQRQLRFPACIKTFETGKF